MRNINFWSGFGFALFTILAILSVIISIVTYTYHDISHNGFLGFLAVNHLWIMLITIIISIGYGFAWAFFLQKRLVKEQKTTKSIFDIVLSFLSADESAVLKHLVEEKGISTQSKISHIGDMGAVKALRTVQKMQDKNLVTIEKQGKVRKIKLKPEIFALLQDQ